MQVVHSLSCGSGLLLVDALLLATLASNALGKPPEAFMGGFSGAAGAAAAARAAPALQLAWRALHGALLQLERPTGKAGQCCEEGVQARPMQAVSNVRCLGQTAHSHAAQLARSAQRTVSLLHPPAHTRTHFSPPRPLAVVFIRAAEQLLCSSFEANDAFLAAFGLQSALEQSLEGGAGGRAPLVLLGGLCADESPAALAGKRPQRQLQPGYAGSGKEGEEGEDDEERMRPGGAGEGEMGRVCSRWQRLPCAAARAVTRAQGLQAPPALSPPLPCVTHHPRPQRAGRGKGLFGASAAGGSDDLDALDDELGLGDLLLSLSKLAGESQRPNARK